MILTLIATLIVIFIAGVLLVLMTNWEPVEDWCIVMRRSATTWVTYGIQTICTTVAVHWAVMLGVLPFLPFHLQLPLALLIAAVTTAPTIIARLTKQPRLEEKIKEKRNADT